MRWNKGDIAFAFILIASILYLGYHVERDSFLNVLLGYGAAFAAYFHFIHYQSRLDFKVMLILALLLRLCLLVSTPLLSDDYFRFIWDGLLQVDGINPFSIVPSEFSESDRSLIFEGLNSKDYYSVYPTVMQWVFRLAAFSSGDSIIGNLVFMRVVLILADLLLVYYGIKLLHYLGKQKSDVLIYAMNPLVIIEGVGNLHFEGMMMAFTVMGLFFITKSTKVSWSWVIGAVALSLGIATKLTSLLVTPAFLRWKGAKGTIIIGLMVLGFLVLLFSPFITEELVHNFSSSLDLYFRNFQFNSSVYNVVDALTAHLIPHYRAEVIGPWISLGGVILMVLILAKRKSGDAHSAFETILFLLSIHVLFSSTVHPWYAINLLVICLFTKYRYPVLFTFLAVLSYHFYDLNHESAFILICEYGLVISYALWEIVRWGKENGSKAESGIESPQYF